MIKSIDVTDFIKSKFIKCKQGNTFSIEETLFLNSKVDFLHNNNFFLAGGFAREIYRILNISDNLHRSLEFNKSIFKTSSDLDFFYFGDKNIDEVIQSYNKSSASSFNEILHGYHVKNNHDIPFVKNVCAFNTFIFTPLDVAVKVQAVSMNNYSSIKSIFDSFDLENCKFLLKLDKNRYTIFFTEEAELCEKIKSIKISRAYNPLLLQRLNKYVQRKNLRLEACKENLALIKQWIYKFISNDWSEKDIELSEQSFVTLTSVVSDFFDTNDKFVDNEILTLLLGKIKINKVNFNNAYSFIHSNLTQEYDWAANRIMVNSNEKRKEI